MNIKNLKFEELQVVKQVIEKELKYEKRLKNPVLKEFRIAFLLAKEAIEIEEVSRKQYYLI